MYGCHRDFQELKETYAVPVTGLALLIFMIIKVALQMSQKGWTGTSGDLIPSNIPALVPRINFGSQTRNVSCLYFEF